MEIIVTNDDKFGICNKKTIDLLCKNTYIERKSNSFFAKNKALVKKVNGRKRIFALTFCAL